LVEILPVGGEILQVPPDSGHNHWNFITIGFSQLVIFFRTIQTPENIFRKIIFSKK